MVVRQFANPLLEVADRGQAVGEAGDCIGAGGLLQLQLQRALMGEGLQKADAAEGFALAIADGFPAVQHQSDALVLQLQAMLEAEGLTAQPRLAHACCHQIAILGMHTLQQQLKAGRQVRIDSQDAIGLR